MTSVRILVNAKLLLTLYMKFQSTYSKELSIYIAVDSNLFSVFPPSSPFMELAKKKVQLKKHVNKNIFYLNV